MGRTRFRSRTGDNATDPAWSPDGHSIAFASERGGKFDIYPAGERPAWHPDGRKIAYNGFDCDYYFTKCDLAGVVIATLEWAEDVVLAWSGQNPVWRP